MIMSVLEVLENAHDDNINVDTNQIFKDLFSPVYFENMITNICDNFNADLVKIELTCGEIIVLRRFTCYNDINDIQF